jgi:murein DD-endopeptidase MepM/ murein hydrolase activator NlpD
MSDDDLLSFFDSNSSKRKQRMEEASLGIDSILQSMKNASAPDIGSDAAWGDTDWKAGLDWSSGTSWGSGSSWKTGLDWSTIKNKQQQQQAQSKGGPLPKMKGKVHPVTGARISQEWGKSRIKYSAGRHTGMDFSAPSLTPVVAAASGRVVRAGWEGSYGNNIAIRHADGTTTTYGHLNSIGVRPGQTVKAGAYIGKLGNTGRSTGPHLHFEVRKTDKYGGDINPRSWFSTR